jgi:PAS domain S-box-containing protein
VDGIAAFVSLIEHSSDGIVVTDSHARVVRWNGASERILGLPRAQALGRPLCEIADTLLPAPRTSPSRSEICSFFKGLLSEGRVDDQAEPVEREIVRPDGNRRIVEARLYTLRAGSETGIGCIFSDVSDHRRVEDDRLRLIDLIESSRDLIAVLDLQGRLLYLNGAGRRMLGELGEGPAVRLRDLLPLERGDAFESELLSSVLDAGSLSGSGAIRRTDGRRIDIEYRLFPVRSHRTDEATDLALVVEDVTQRRDAERALEQGRDKLHQLQRLESVGRLAGGIAHDFNNLMTAVMGYSELALMEDDLTDSVRESIGGIKRSAGRAAFLTRQLLAFGRKQLLRPEELDLNRLLEELRPDIERWAGERTSLVLRLDSRIGSIEIDQHQLERVLEHIVTNARDAMPDGGALEITTTGAVVDALDSQDREMGTMRPGSYVLLAIRDTGQGMDEATRAQIFDPYFTTKDVGMAAGLGLSMAYGVIKQSGGYIWVDSVPGSGTTVRVYLPLPQAVAPSSWEDAEGLYGSEKLLVVEREGVLRTMIARVLGNLGYAVRSCRSLDEAGSPVAERADLIILDARDVADAGDRVRPVDVLSLGRRIMLTTDFPSGPWDPRSEILQKPFTPDQLARKVRRILDQTSG